MEKTLKERFEETKERAKWKACLAKEWCIRNKEAIIVLGPVIAGGVVEVVKISTKRRTIKEEKALKERYIYDHSTGHYYEMRRKPKNSELLQIDQRKREGESLGWILNDMRLLK